ncbi:unnamed protein product [Cunninghamella blakesleeana]
MNKNNESVNHNSSNSNSNRNNNNNHNNSKTQEPSERKNINTQSTTTRHCTIPRINSTRTPIDSSFIEVIRSIHQIKSIVQSLLNFQAEVIPTLSLSTYYDSSVAAVVAAAAQQNKNMNNNHNHNHNHNNSNVPPIKRDLGSLEFINQIQHYLDDTFQKLERLCKIIMMILSRLEQTSQVKQERIISFRNDIIDEWRIAIDIRQRLQAFLNQNTNLFDGSINNNNSNDDNNDNINNINNYNNNNNTGNNGS